MPTQRRLDRRIAVRSRSSGTSALTIGPRTVARTVELVRRPATDPMLSVPLVERAASVSPSRYRPGSAGSTVSRYRSRVDAALLVMAQAVLPFDAPPQPGKPGMAGAGDVVLRPVQAVFVPARGHPERLVRIAARIGLPLAVCGCRRAPSCCCRSRRPCPQRPAPQPGRRTSRRTAAPDSPTLPASDTASRNASSAIRCAASAAMIRSMRPFSDHQIPRPIATTSAHRERPRRILEHAGTRSAASSPNASICRLMPATSASTMPTRLRVHRVRLARRDRRDADRAVRDVAREIGGPEHLGLPPSARRRSRSICHSRSCAIATPSPKNRSGRRPGIDVRHPRPVAQDLDLAAHRGR